MIVVIEIVVVGTAVVVVVVDVTAGVEARRESVSGVGHDHRSPLKLRMMRELLLLGVSLVGKLLRGGIGETGNGSWG